MIDQVRFEEQFTLVNHYLSRAKTHTKYIILAVDTNLTSAKITYF